MLRVTSAVEAKALAAGTARWLEDLTELVSSLEREWGFVLGEPYEDASEAFVSRVVLSDGSPAVLKVVLPQAHDGARRETVVLEAAAGDGCVALFRADDARGAMLLEQLGPSLATSGLDVTSRQEILVDLARRVWRRAAEMELPTGADQARSLAELIQRRWEGLGRPCSEGAMAYARACAEERALAHDVGRAVLVHGDVHQWNALQTTGGYELVDPDGLLAEPECDLGVIMREDPVELLGDGHERSRWLAHRTGLDERAIWQWGAAERVSTGLLLVEIGVEPVGSQMLEAAERVTPRA